MILQRRPIEWFASILASLSVIASLVVGVWSTIAGGYTFAVENNRPAFVLLLFLPGLMRDTDTKTLTNH
jgi:hypothetical protein